MTVSNPRPIVLILCDWFLPGYRAGGPVRALANLVEHLGDEYSFRVITRDRDLGGDPYPHVKPDSWQAVGKASVFYCRARAVADVVAETPHDVLYLNSFFSPVFSVGPMWRRWRGGLSRRLAVLAPRGEFSPAALSIKKIRKRVYIWLARNAGVYRDALFHASADADAADIRRVFPGASVGIVPDLPSPIAPLPSRRPKEPGRLRVLFLSRLNRMKNLEGAIEVLRGVEGQVELSIYGPKEDSAYWAECERLMHGVRAQYQGSVPPEDVPALMAEHDLLLLPTRGENFGHVIFEAFSAGCPVLVSDRTPWRDLERRGAGWDLPLGDGEAFRAVLRRCVAMGADEHAAWSRSAYDFARHWLRESDAAGRMRRFFNEALMNSPDPTKLGES